MDKVINPHICLSYIKIERRSICINVRCSFFIQDREYRKGKGISRKTSHTVCKCMQILGLFGAVIGSQIIIVLVPILWVRRKCEQKQSETAIIFFNRMQYVCIKFGPLGSNLMHTRKGETYVKKTKYKISISALYQHKFQRRNGQTFFKIARQR